MRLYGEVDRFVMPLHEPGVIDHFLRQLCVTHQRRRKVSLALGRGVRFQRIWSIADRPTVLEGRHDVSRGVESCLETVVGLLDGGSGGGRLLEETPLAGTREVAWLLVDHGAPGRVRSTLFVYSPGGRRPAAVLKLRSGPEGSAELERESRALHWLHARLPGPLRRSIPHSLRLHGIGDLSILVESHLEGRSLYVDMSRSLWPSAKIRRHFRTAAGWLADFHSATRSRRTVDGHVDALLSGRGRTSGMEPGLHRRLRDLLANRDIRFSARHGDYWLHNLLDLGEGGTGVVDWEAFREESFPDVDLIFFPLTYGLAFPWTRGGRPSALLAFRRTFLEHNVVSRGVRDYLEIYCGKTGLPFAALEPLLHHYLCAPDPLSSIDRKTRIEMARLASAARWNVCRP